jgi:hypothetical protein
MEDGAADEFEMGGYEDDVETFELNQLALDRAAEEGAEEGAEELEAESRGDGEKHEPLADDAGSQGQAARTFMCHCCGSYFESAKPADCQRDAGYGTCISCHPMVATSWAKHGFPGVTDLESAYARLRRYA